MPEPRRRTDPSDPRRVSPERWELVKNVFTLAVEQDAAQRGAFLDQTCAGDLELRREVESLLASDDAADGFLATPPLARLENEAAVVTEAGDGVVAGADPELPPGTRLERYEVIALLGRGGMGEVYRARDIRLGRRVAVKVLPAALAERSSRLRLFEREARAASALNHPNLVTLYDVGAFENRPYITMELVEGEDLRDLMRGGPLPVPRLLDIAVQIAEGLDAAHAAGIVHRDLKPDNVMVSASGWVKILDFGLAQLSDPPGLAPDPENPQDSGSLTRSGAVFGTVGYVAPEQARGQAVDFRADHFSLGAMLYEMAAGTRAFGTGDTLQVLDATLYEPPKPLAGQVPPALAALIHRCLAKDPAERFPSTHELLRALRRCQDDASPGAPRRRLGRRLWPVAFAATVGAVGAVALMAGRRQAPPAVHVASLAVLPFENASGDPTGEYVSDGISEGLIRTLSELPRLKVLNPSTVLRYKGHVADAPDVGRTLGVAAVLAGTVHYTGETVSVEAELHDVAGGARLWSGRLTRDSDELAALQEDISREIAHALRPALTDAESRGLAQPPTHSLEAHRAYMRGRHFWKQRTPAGFQKAVVSFQEAIEKDPQFALAHAGLGDAYALLTDYGFLPPDVGVARTRIAAMKALELDERCAEAHACLAGIKFQHDWDWPAAEREYRRALELNPSYATAYQWYAEFLITTGRTDEALATVRRAQELDPLSPVVQTSVGWMLRFARRYDEAAVALKHAIELEPYYIWAHVRLGEALQNGGRRAEAIAQTHTTLTIMTQGGVSQGTTVIEAHLEAARGHEAKALALLDTLHDPKKRSPIDSYSMAAVYAALGANDQALRWLEQACHDRVNFVVYAGVDPWLEPLHGDPRFDAVLRRIGVPHVSRRAELSPPRARVR
jgi:TolB-like protein